MDDYITKPLRRKELLAIVKKWTKKIDDFRLPMVDCGTEITNPQPTTTANDQSATLNPQSSIINPWPRPGLTRSKGEMPDIKHQQNQKHPRSISRLPIPSRSRDGEGGHQSKRAAPMDFEMVIEEFEGDKEIFMEVLESFLEKAGAQLGTIRQAISDRDAEVVRKEAHSIKGCAANLTADDLSGIASELERIGKSGVLEGGTDVLERLEREFLRLQACAGDR